MEAGIIEVWVAAKGFGFVKLRNGDSTLAFLHISDIINPPKDDLPRPGDIVLFDLVHAEGQERPKAVRAILIMASEDE
jgi:cold shock CspA family protein